MTGARDLERATGAVVYRGPSLLDGAPIVVVVTGIRTTSENTKTGAMAQTWVLRSDVHPVEAVHTGADESICGGCALRPLNAAAGAPRCYVNKGFGPAAVYRALQRGIYPDAAPADVFALVQSRGLHVRFGSYGDPAAVPVDVWRAMDSRRHTGYTHQWRTAPALRPLAMASADNIADAHDAWFKGWRTFRVVRSVDELTRNEVLCPASEEAGRRTTCARCGLCNGATGAVGSDRRKSVAIVDHGPTRKRGARAAV